MNKRPALIRLCYPLFVVTVIALGGLGMLQIWAPMRADWMEKSVLSLAILAGVSGLVLAAWRTVMLAARADD